MDREINVRTLIKQQVKQVLTFPNNVIAFRISFHPILLQRLGKRLGLLAMKIERALESFNGHFYKGNYKIFSHNRVQFVKAPI